MKQVVRLLLLLGLAAAVAWPACGLAQSARMTPATLSREQAAAERVTPGLRRDLAAMGLSLGDPIFIRIFKHEHQLEVWLRKQGRYALFRQYPICTWSGALGPKLRQGDGQSPEGFYSVGRGQLNPQSSYHLSFNLGYPNAYDRAHGRSGNYLMVHGHCVSIGCYAMGDANIEQIYTLLDAALRGGQRRVDVHVFPFRFDKPAMADWQTQRWGDFWGNLKQGHDAFERTKVPPAVNVANLRYRIMERAATASVAAPVR